MDMVKPGAVREPLCFLCQHLTDWPTCAAFPEEIPLSIRTAKRDHTKPYRGDNGIQFEPVKGAKD